MNLKRHPFLIVTDLLSRSTCAVQVAALLVDPFGPYCYGWNNSGRDGMGQHAEAHCLSRANKARLEGSTLYVAAQRVRRSGRIGVVTARPCLDCQHLLRGVKAVVYRDGKGEWHGLHHLHEEEG